MSLCASVGPPSEVLVEILSGIETGKASAGDDKSQQGTPNVCATLKVSFFEVRDQAVAQVDRIAERLHRQRAPLKAGEIEEVSD